MSTAGENDHVHADMPKEHNGSPTGAHIKGSYEKHESAIKAGVDAKISSAHIEPTQRTREAEYKKAGA